LITGAPGNGKTALLNRILQTGNRRLGVLANKFAEILIDCEL
jgi:G3E family GTPase